eukprot:7275772-Ditylum_brightwellii.AAC.1
MEIETLQQQQKRNVNESNTQHKKVLNDLKNDPKSKTLQEQEKDSKHIEELQRKLNQLLMKMKKYETSMMTMDENFKWKHILIQ